MVTGAYMAMACLIPLSGAPVTCGIEVVLKRLFWDIPVLPREAIPGGKPY